MIMKHGWVRVSVLLTCSAMGLSGCASAIGEEASRDPLPAAVPGTLTAAHEAYLDGDFVALGERVRDVLLDPGATPRVKQNAFELLDKAYEVKGGALPSAFKLPAGYGGLQYVIFHNMTPQGPSYQVHLRVLARDVSHVTGLTVRRLPDETLLDKATGKGHSQIRHDPGTSAAQLDELVLDSGPIATPPADGVIAIRLELDDGTVAEGFFIAQALASTTTPEVRSPAPWASVTDPNPEVTWAPFRSPECAGFEQRGLGVQVQREGESPLAWEVWSNKPDERSTVRLGSSVGVGRAALTPGDYRVMVVASETRAFGPVAISRASRTFRPFHVAP
jgi:hypothetical protein